MSNPQEVKIAVTTTGSAGAAMGDTDSSIPLSGYLLGFRVDYHASAPATTDVVITAILPTGYPADTLFTASNNNTDIPYRPIQREIYDDSNTATGLYSLIPLSNHRIKVTVNEADALDPCVTVWVIYMKGE